MNRSFSDVEEMQSACDSLTRLENGKEIQILGGMGDERYVFAPP